MAKPLIIEKNGQSTSFDVSLLERRKLYGSRKRVALDSQGRVCSRASLTADGAQVLTSGSTGQGYFTENGKWVERRQMVPINDQGQVTELHPSTLGMPQKVEGPVEALDILKLDVQSIYLLTMLDDKLGLKPRLEAGEIFKCPFNYSSSMKWNGFSGGECIRVFCHCWTPGRSRVVCAGSSVNATSRCRLPRR